MKTLKISLLTLSLLLLVNLPVYAASDSTQENVEYLENGDYIETTITIEPTLTRASTRSGSKTVTYKNSAGTAMWSITVSASFSYTSGKSSKCTSASGSATTYSSNWKVSSPGTSRSGNKATSTATGSHYSGSSFVASYTRSATLSCDTYGNLS